MSKLGGERSYFKHFILTRVGSVDSTGSIGGFVGFFVGSGVYSGLSVGLRVG